jgi:hypothetical protein
VRRRLIQITLPFVFCTVPFLVAILIAAAIPPGARTFFLNQLQNHPEDHLIDVLILALGSTLFLFQMGCAWRALQWRGTGFNDRPDRWLTNLAQAAEWFPLLGLIGTVAGIMVTFSKIDPEMKSEEIIQHYAPAITATGTGLFMALANILPTWTVLIGRDLIQGLAGEPPATIASATPAARPASAARR